VNIYRVNDAIGSFGLGLVQQLIGVAVRLVALQLAVPFAVRVDLGAIPALRLVGATRFPPTYWRCSERTFGLLCLPPHVPLLARAVVASILCTTREKTTNLGTALRQSALGFVTSWVFFWPLAVIGLPPGPALAHAQLNLLFQFWIHTAMVR